MADGEMGNHANNEQKQQVNRSMRQPAQRS